MMQRAKPDSLAAGDWVLLRKSSGDVIGPAHILDRDVPMFSGHVAAAVYRDGALEAAVLDTGELAACFRLGATEVQAWEAAKSRTERDRLVDLLARYARWS